MKKVLLSVLIIMTFKIGLSQTWDEWFKQKSTEKKYLIEQIAAFQLYGGSVQKGYSIARKGLGAIGEIKQGDFNLHNHFFGSLKSVNPPVRKYSKVADIIAFQLKIIQTYKETYKSVQANNLYSSDEIAFIYKVFTNLINDCASDIDALITVITKDAVEMKDDERLEKVNTIYTSMQDKYAFARSFGDEAKVLSVEKFIEKNNIETTSKLYGLEK